MRRIGIEERRARLGLRHHLAGTARAGVVEVARDLVGLHATDPATVYLAARARMLDPGVAAVEQALYEDRALVRILGMRRTMFVEPVELMGVVQAACTDAIATQQRRLLVDLVGRAGLADDPPGWIEEVEKVAVSGAGGPRRSDRRRAGQGRPPPRPADRARRGQAVRGPPERGLPHPAAAGRRGPDRPRPPSRVLGQRPVPLVGG